MNLTDFIPSGAANAVTAEKIAEKMNIDARAVRSLVQIERQQGRPICASCAEPFGLYIAETIEELAQYKRSLRRRLNNIFATYLAISATLDEMIGQQRMEDFFEDDLWGGDTD